jgi:Tol biopolymer transport system component
MSVISSEAGERRRLLKPGPDTNGDTMPSLSPDGRALAFCRISNVGYGDIYLVHLTQDLRSSGDPIQITNEKHNIQGLDFTSDGREIIFSSDRAGKTALWRVPARSGGTPEPLALLTEDASQVRIARSAGRLVYVRNSAASAIRRIRISGSAADVTQAEPFLPTSREQADAQYSPDGLRVALGSNRSGSFEIWLANTDGSNPLQLTSFGSSADAGGPTWSPKSDRVAFTVLSHTLNRPEIYWMSVSGRQAVRLSDGISPVWSRDGNWVYFVTGYPASPQIWKISPTGGRRIQVTQNGGVCPQESTDGKFLYYGRDVTCRSLWRLPIGGGEEQHVLDVQGFWSTFTLVGDDIYYMVGADPSSRASIESFRPVTGERKHVATVEKPSIQSNFSVSKDRRFLIYTLTDRETSELMLVEHFR